MITLDKQYVMFDRTTAVWCQTKIKSSYMYILQLLHFTAVRIDSLEHLILFYFFSPEDTLFRIALMK